jgi:hypothetical protein
MAEPRPDPRSPERIAADAERAELLKSEELAHNALDSAREKVTQFHVERIKVISAKHPDGWAELAEAVMQGWIDCERFGLASRAIVRGTALGKLNDLNDVRKKERKSKVKTS